MRLLLLYFLGAALAACATRPQARIPILNAPLPVQVETPADTGLFGIILNKPLGGFGECSAHQSIYKPKEFSYDYGAPSNQPCYQRLTGHLIGSGFPLGNEKVMIQWPILKSPPISSNNSAVVLLLDGVVHSISITTWGIQRQITDLAELTTKFGVPTQKKVEPVQNRMGARFDKLTAAWSRPSGISVIYLGTVTHLDSGLLEVSTAKASAHNKQESEELANQRLRM